MDAKRLLDFVSELERRIDMSAWVINGINFWPTVRMQILFGMFRTANQTTAPRRGSVFRRMAGFLRLCAQVAVAALWPAKNRLPGDVWLVSSGYSYLPPRYGVYETYCSPLLRACELLGYRAVLFDYTPRFPLRMDDRTVLWVHRVLPIKLFGVVASKIYTKHALEKCCRKINEVAHSLGYPQDVVDEKGIYARIFVIKHLSRYFERQIRKYQPRAVFVVCYYNVEGLALSLAARRAGVPLVDVQHGVTGATHPAYVGYPAEEIDAAELLPGFFWSWNEQDAQLINRWASCDGRGCAFVGGNPIAQAWLAGWVPNTCDQMDRSKLFPEKNQELVHVLVTLQPGLMRGQHIAPLLNAMRKSENCFWWVRLHPTSGGERAGMDELFKERSIRNYEIDGATKAALPALLSMADLHVTHSSSVVLEADAFGVHSFVWSDYGRSLYPELIDAGKIAADLSGKIIIEAINTRRYFGTRAVSERPLILTTFKEIMNRCENYGGSE